MTKVQYQKALAKLEREADEKGCCILPAKPLFDPDDRPAPRRSTNHGPRGGSR